MKVEQIIQIWRSEGVQMQTGVSTADIVALELLTGFSFPDSFKEFYRLANGFANGDWTPGMFYMWPIEEISIEWQSSQQKEFIPFCDFLINSHQIGFLTFKPGIFVQYGIANEPELPICIEFLEALKLILLDASEVH